MNWIDKTIFIGDNLHIMRGMNSASVDLIYLDSRSILNGTTLPLSAAEPPVLPSKTHGHLTT